MKEIYPGISRFIERTPNRRSTIITWILTIFISADMFISAAVVRWTQRNNIISSESVFEQYSEQRYPDDFLKEIYPNMTIVK